LKNLHPGDPAGVPTHDGGYLVASSGVLVKNQPAAVLLVKLDSHGDSLWTQSYTEKDSDETIYDVMETHDKGFLLTGKRETYSTVGSENLLLIKTDSLGKLQWQYTYLHYATAFEANAGVRVIETLDSAYAIAGYYVGPSPGDYDQIYLIKVSKSGKLIWSYVSDEGFYPKGLVQLTSDSSFIMTGGTFDFYSGHPNGVLFAKVFKNGKQDSLKVKTRMKINNNYTDVGANIVKMPDGGFMIAGTMGSIFGGPATLFAMRTNKYGDTLWIKTYPKPFAKAWCSDMIRTASGNFVLTGYFSDSVDLGSFTENVYSVFLLKINAKGDTLFSKRMQWAATVEPTRIHECSDKGLFITANFDDLFGPVEMIAIKTDSLGNVPGCYNPITSWGTDSTSACASDSIRLQPTLVDPDQYTYQWYLNDTILVGATSFKYLPTKTGYYTVTATNKQKCSNTSSPRYLRINTVGTVSAGKDDTACYWRGYYSLNGLPYGGYWTGPGVLNNTQVDLTRATPGRHLYTYTVSNTAGCSNSDSFRLYIDTVRPATPVLSAIGGTSSCIGDTVTLLATTSGNIGYYNWNTGLNEGNHHKITQSGQYAMNVVGRNGCPSDTSNKLNIKFWPIPAWPIIVAVHKDSLMSDTAGKYYEWSVDGQILPDTVRTIKPIKSGNYVVRIKDDHCFSLYSPIYKFIKTGIGPGPGYGNTEIYPNPVKNILTIQFDGLTTDKREVKIYNISGQLVWQSIVSPSRNNVELNVHALLPGMYCIQVSGQGNDGTYKFLKE